MREVESWVVSGIASAWLWLFFCHLGLPAAGASAAVVGIIGIIIASFIGALIDDKFIDRLNNEIIRPCVLPSRVYMTQPEYNTEHKS